MPARTMDHHACMHHGTGRFAIVICVHADQAAVRAQEAAVRAQEAAVRVQEAAVRVQEGMCGLSKGARQYWSVA